MNKINERVYLISLFGFYKNLLTDKQQTYFQKHYYADWSLNEIADEFHVSKNAVYDSLQKIYKLLHKYEMLLHLHEKQTGRMQLYDRLENEELKKEFLRIEEL
ncbi:DNA-binding protein [Ureaplasma miroungigenitalium]|uniref:UPF0122 protein OF376_02080 n=1 Tax=Ureaplasma miroungigenitalium TaxID=1042321 RepID=A0ABT3BMV5_9BACT|nr:DNA-binding protein [Ureaplasma miroungigenitalium]MCV3728552.1 DNA-binding protein [Ureaplasma miroungigenitalium]MCV3734441.1 DNA-binding protein [Ureaplasma miroungigenitalium]